MEATWTDRFTVGPAHGAVSCRAGNYVSVSGDRAIMSGSIPRAEEDDVSGVSPENLAANDLLRELEHLHHTRHDTFMHGAPDALREHSSRCAELEQEYLRRHPERHVDPARTRSGARTGDTSAS